MRTIAGSLVLLCVVTSGCSTSRMVPTWEDGASGVGGSEGGDSSGDDGASGQSTGDPAAETSCRGRCTDDRFDAWAGPVVVHHADADGMIPACGGAYDAIALEGFSEFSADAASCDCRCGEAVGSTCNPVVRRYTEGCGSEYARYVVDGGACVDIPDEPGGAFWDVTTPSPEGGACEPSLEVDIVPPRFSDAVRLCESNEVADGTCENGDCAPAPAADDGPLCYWREGDVECPAGEKTRVYDGQFEDTRDCGACECEAPQGACVWEYASVSLSPGGDCFFGNYLAIDECTRVTLDVAAIYASNIDPEVSCTPSGGAPIGDVTPTGVVTMCCLE